MFLFILVTKQGQLTSPQPLSKGEGLSITNTQAGFYFLDNKLLFLSDGSGPQNSCFKHFIDFYPYSISCTSYRFRMGTGRFFQFYRR